RRRALRRGDDLWASFLTGFIIAAAPAAVVTLVWLVKCIFDICSGGSGGKMVNKKKA
ncbi:unnamed protein product, partial [Symbiodinium pilosum]